MRAILFDLNQTLWQYPVLRTAEALHARHVRRIMGIRAVWKRNGRRQPNRADNLLPPDAVIDDLWELRRLPLLLDQVALDVPRQSDGLTAPSHG